MVGLHNHPYRDIGKVRINTAKSLIAVPMGTIQRFFTIGCITLSPVKYIFENPILLGGEPFAKLISIEPVRAVKGSGERW